MRGNRLGLDPVTLVFGDHLGEREAASFGVGATGAAVVLHNRLLGSGPTFEVGGGGTQTFDVETGRHRVVVVIGKSLFTIFLGLAP